MCTPKDDVGVAACIGESERSLSYSVQGGYSCILLGSRAHLGALDTDHFASFCCGHAIVQIGNSDGLRSVDVEL